jgi:hypothetical protein
MSCSLYVLYLFIFVGSTVLTIKILKKVKRNKRAHSLVARKEVAFKGEFMIPLFVRNLKPRKQKGSRPVLAGVRLRWLFLTVGFGVGRICLVCYEGRERGAVHATLAWASSMRSNMTDTCFPASIMVILRVPSSSPVSFHDSGSMRVGQLLCPLGD